MANKGKGINRRSEKPKRSRKSKSPEVLAQKRPEEPFVESEAQLLHYLSENLTEGMVYQINSGPDGKERRFTYLGPAVERFHGLKKEEVLKNPMLLYNQVIEEDRALLAERESCAYDSRTRLDVDVRVLLPSGELRWRRFKSSPRACPDGSVIWDGIEIDITEQKQAEEALREDEERWRSLIETSTAWIWATDANMRHTYTNAFVTKYLGYQTEEFLRFDTLSLVHPDDRYLMRKLVENAAALKTGWFDQVIRWKHKDGSWRYIESSGSALFDECGKFAGLHGVDRDITERMWSEEKLRESEEKYKFLVEATNTGYVILGDGGLVIDANAEYVKMSGHNRLGDIIGRSIVEWTAAHDRERNAEEVKRCLQQGFVRNLEIDYVNKQGRFTPVEINATVMRSETAVRIFSICRDITERKRSERENAEQKAMLQQIMDTASVGIGLVDKNGCFIHANKSMADMFGCTREELIGSQYVDHVHPSEREIAGKSMRALLASETLSVSLDRRYLRKNGTEFWGHLICNRFYDSRGNNLGLIGAITDITKNKLAEEKLLESEKRLRAIVERAAEGIVVADAETKAFRFANPEICRMLGYTSDELLRLSVPDIHPEEERPAVSEEFRQQLTGSLIDTQTICRKKDGSLIHVSIRSTPFEIDGRKCLLGFFTDITERRLLEEERMKTEKLEATGLLAGGIAHDFNNLLQGIFGYIAMAKMNIEEKERALEMLEEAEHALQLSVNLTTQLLTFSKGGQPVKKPLRLKPVIENAVKFALSGSRTNYLIDIEDNLLQVEADEGQIVQAIHNIVLNADQAMPFGGTVIVTAKNVQPAEKKRKDLPDKNRYVEIAIQDSGVGVPKQYLSSIFDPYFTTKDKGSGIGLATTYSIIRNHGGLIDVKSEVGKGTIFFIYLPVVEEKESVLAVQPVPTVVRSIRVLLMDDDERLRGVAEKMIKAVGHEAVCVSDGEAAIGEYLSAMESGKAYDVVILDLTVRGGMGGEETIKKLLAIDPGVKAIVSSGYFESSIMSEYREHGFMACLRKPYRINELSTVLNNLISQSAVDDEPNDGRSSKAIEGLTNGPEQA